MTARAVVVVVALLAGGCGGGSSPTGPTVRVAAASSLGPVLKSCTRHLQGATVRLELGSSSALGTEIRHGVLPDVFLASNMGTPRALAREHRIAAPVAFASNPLVIAVPAGDNSVRSVADLTRPGVTIAMGDVSGPLGQYTRSVLARLPTDQRIAVLANVRVQQPDAAHVVAQLAGQATRAGLVFASDVAAAHGTLRAVALPAQLQPTLVYGGANVNGSPQPRAAQRVMADILRGGCARALRRAGFGPPPR